MGKTQNYRGIVRNPVRNAGKFSGAPKSVKARDSYEVRVSDTYTTNSSSDGAEFYDFATASDSPAKLSEGLEATPILSEYPQYQGVLDECVAHTKATGKVDRAFVESAVRRRTQELVAKEGGGDADAEAVIGDGNVDYPSVQDAGSAGPRKTGLFARYSPGAIKRWAHRKSLAAKNHVSKAAFTLIELLVVVSIIMILAAMLLPVIGKAIKKARKTACLNNQKQILIGMMIYADESEGYIPRGPPVDETAGPHLYDTMAGVVNHGHFYSAKMVNALASFYCPDASFFTPTSSVGGMQNWGTGNVVSSYIWRNKSGGNIATRLDAISNASGTAAFLDCNIQANLERHNHNVMWVNIGAFDGHAAGVDDTNSVKWSFSGGDRDVVFTEADKKLR